MVLTDAAEIPLGIDIVSASTHVITLVEPLIEKRVFDETSSLDLGHG